MNGDISDIDKEIIGTLNIIRAEHREDMHKLRSELSEVKTQTTKTNGRVNMLELKLSKPYLIGLRLVCSGAIFGVFETIKKYV